MCKDRGCTCNHPKGTRIVYKPDQVSVTGGKTQARVKAESFLVLLKAKMIKYPFIVSSI